MAPKKKASQPGDRFCHSGDGFGTTADNSAMKVYQIYVDAGALYWDVFPPTFGQLEPDRQEVWRRFAAALPREVETDIPSGDARDGVKAEVVAAALDAVQEAIKSETDGLLGDDDLDAELLAIAKKVLDDAFAPGSTVEDYDNCNQHGGRDPGHFDADDLRGLLKTSLELMAQAAASAILTEGMTPKEFAKRLESVIETKLEEL